MKIRRIVHGVFLVLGMSVVGLLFYYTVWLFMDEGFREMMRYGWPWNSWMVLVDYLACCLITTVVTLCYWHWRERTERERDMFRLQALENQLSPHFVFNNFSILADLIEVDQKRASDYLMNLSKVYRYTLSHLDHSTVTLQEELEFLHRYLALLQQRFGEGIKVTVAPDVVQKQGKLPPAALQMLIENAIKHNEHTTARPLIIDVMSDGQRICVRNNKQPIEVAGIQDQDSPTPTRNLSSNIGQHNIAERYRLLTHQKVVIRDTADEYSVTIPLIPLDR